MIFDSYDHIIGGTGQDYIVWFTKEQFIPWKGEPNVLFAVYGVKSPEKLPKVGDTVYCEFTKSHMLFRFMDIRMSPEQENTFFGEVRPIKQIIKAGHEGDTTKLILL